MLSHLLLRGFLNIRILDRKHKNVEPPSQPYFKAEIEMFWEVTLQCTRSNTMNLSIFASLHDDFNAWQRTNITISEQCHGWNNDYSKEDKDILFCSKEECCAYEENWLQQSHSQVETTPRRASNRVKFETPAKDCACQFGGAESPGTSSVPDQNVETICPSKLHKSPARLLGEMCKKVSESLLAPTQTSRAKQQALVEKEMKHKARPITERAVSYTRHE